MARTTFPNHAETFAAFVRGSVPLGYGPSIWFQGDTAYSYATPIGRIVRNERGDVAFLLTTRSFSTSSSKHVSRLWSAMYNNGKATGRPIFRVRSVKAGGWNDGDWTHAAALEHYAERIQTEEARAARARVYKSTEWADRLRVERESYCTFFGLPQVDSEDVREAARERVRKADAPYGAA